MKISQLCASMSSLTPEEEREKNQLFELLESGHMITPFIAKRINYFCDEDNNLYYELSDGHFMANIEDVEEAHFYSDVFFDKGVKYGFENIHVNKNGKIELFSLDNRIICKKCKWERYR